MTIRRSTACFVVSFCIQFLCAFECLAGPCLTAGELRLRLDRLNQWTSSPMALDSNIVDAFMNPGGNSFADPRLIAALAGAESTFGQHICTPYNAWNWFHCQADGTCSSNEPFLERCRKSPYGSWEEGIKDVAQGISAHYLAKGRNTIELIGERYCGEGCADWVNNVKFFYTSLNGDLGDLTLSSSCAFWLPTSGADLSNTVFTGALVTTPAGELWAPTSRGCFDRDALGVLRSTDRGLNWTPVNFGFFSTNVRTLLLTPSSDLFAGAHDGVYRFDRTLGAWNPTGLGGVDVNVLRATTRGLWASDSCFCSGVRQSTDNGQTWQRFDVGLPTCVNAIVQHPATGDLYAGTGTSGVYRLPVGAVSWSPVNEGLGSSDLHSLAINASGDLFAGTIQGLFRRKNGATQWTALTQGLPSDGIQSIGIKSQGKMFIGTFSHGVYASFDNGDTWTEMNAGIPDVSRAVGAIAFDAQGFAYVSVGSIIYRSVSPVE